MQVFAGLMQLIVQGFVSGKRIWIIEDDDNRLVKFWKVQQCWETNVEAPVVDPKKQCFFILLLLLFYYFFYLELSKT